MSKRFLFHVAIALGLGIATAHAAEDRGMRAEIGLGAHWGDPDISFAGESDSLDTGTGLAGSVGAWKDGVGHKNLALGLEFLRLQDGDYSESVSGEILGATLSGDVSLDPTINALLVNAAYRKNDNGRFHPYAGAGIGVARVNATLSASATVTVGSSTFVASGSEDDSDTALAGQLFLGADYDVTSNVYVGAGARYFLTDTNLFGADVDFRNFVVSAKLGFRF
jgi:opacity protein-like surface antigen